MLDTSNTAGRGVIDISNIGLDQAIDAVLLTGFCEIDEWVKAHHNPSFKAAAKFIDSLVVNYYPGGISQSIKEYLTYYFYRSMKRMYNIYDSE